MLSNIYDINVYILCITTTMSLLYFLHTLDLTRFSIKSTIIQYRTLLTVAMYAEEKKGFVPR